MRKMTWRRRVFTTVTTVAMGGAAFQLGQCPQEVRTSVLGGLNGASDALIVALLSAMFTSLDQVGDSSDLTTSPI